MAVTISIDDCTKMIRGALKQGFPNTKFSVRKTRSTYSHNIDVRWTDGPTGAQVKPILDRFESKGFDGMTDCQYYCGNRVLCGVQVQVCGNYVRGTREISPRLHQIVADKLSQETGLTEDYAGRAPFCWHMNWKEGGFTLDEFQNKKYVLASDPHQGEWFSTLIWRVESCVSLEAQQPINAELLPEYIDVNANVSTGRASFEEPQKMFEGHAALDEERQAAAEFEANPLPKIDCHCHIGRSYPKGYSYQC